MDESAASAHLPELGSYKLSRAMLILKEREDFYASLDTRSTPVKREPGIRIEYGVQRVKNGPR
ncbi:hypothetical protein N7501_008998 [Penicillium viridicatum]|nr:hypothetical protein N7501_008998 [Penicillium viridicatum]